MLCPNCKSDIADSAKFCPKCGSASLKPTISTVAPIKLCPKCGTENLIAAKFCKTDGYRFEYAEEPAEQPLPKSPSTVVCPACGTTNPVGAKFCKKDGVRLVGDASPLPHTAAPHSPLVPQALPASPGAVSANLRASVSSPLSEPVGRPTSSLVRSGNARKWAVGVVILLVLVGGGAGGYLYYTGAFVSPTELKSTISAALAAKAINGIAVDVDDDRVATLIGFAEDAAMKDVAVQLARSVKGVKDVVAKLDVLPSISDTENLLSQTLKDQQLPDILIVVDEKRNATLTGNVSDAAMIEVAAKAAAATPGVKNVTNQVRIMATPAATHRVEPQPRTAQQPALRPSSSSKTNRTALASDALTPTPTPTPPSPAPERKRTTCEGIGGLYRLTCAIEGPENYFKCAPDGRNWNNAIPGCDRRTTPN